jgi:hypothetical protein
LVRLVTKIRGGHFPEWSVPIALMGLCVLSYGLLIPRLGFYWDDWGLVWFYKTLGVSGLRGVWAENRPLMDLLFRIAAPIFGDVPWHWHVFGLIARWASALSLWWAFRQVWPERRREAAWLAMLFAVYPGFQQQSISVVYSHYFVVLTMALLSIGLMAAAARDPRSAWLLWVLSIGLGAFSVFALDLFLGLEALRPFILWRVTRERLPSGRASLRRAALLWAPYLAVFGAFLVWRVTVIGFHAYQPILLKEIEAAPAMTLGSLIVTMLQDMAEGGIVAWGRVFVPPEISSFGLRSTLASYAIAAFAVLVVVIYLLHLEPGPDGAGRKAARWGLPAIGVSLVVLFAAGWPFWIAGLPLRLYFPWDRFTLGMMLGGCLLVLGLLESVVRPLAARTILISILIGLAAGAQVQAGISYVRSWQEQRAFFWDLTWRIPGLRRGTLLLSNEIPIDYMTDNSFVAAIDWMYAPGWSSPAMPYMLYDINKRLGRGLPALEEGLDITQDYSATSFTGTTSQALVFDYSLPGCLRVVDQVLDDSSPVIGRDVAAAIPLSRLDLIDPFASPLAALPPHLQGPEPSHGWCYYFEQADLARQVGDWEQIVALGEEAFSQPDHPNQADERIPFIEGYAHLGRWDRAHELTLEALAQNPSTDRILCHAWERLSNDLDPGEEGQTIIHLTIDELGCDFVAASE